MTLPIHSAFLDHKLLSTGPLDSLLPAAWPHREQPGLLIFEHATGNQVDFDWSGDLEEVLRRALPPPAKAGPGRPRLGVVSTEVTLLPRHWEWLNAQPARASGTLRRLVESAMAAEASDPKKRLEALGKILWSLAGNEPNFEEATRALYGADRSRLRIITSMWPGDLPAFVASWV